MRIAQSLSRFGVRTLILVWLLLLVPILLLASVPTSVSVQGLLAIVMLATLIILKPFVQVSFRLRIVMLAVASVFTLRYWLWRLTETLPSLDDPLSFAAAIVLFSGETFTVCLFFLTALVTADPTEANAAPRVRLNDVPSVDILVPSYNEPDELLAVTLAAAKQINYPEDRKKVILCDDGGTDQRCNHIDPSIAGEARARRARLQELCRKMGVIYATRERNESAKAGNLNAALKNLNGELFLVLDADHVPTRDFLARTVGFFVENPRLFLVQTPHFFTNRDPIERNLGLPESCPSENEMFYSTIHRGLDRLGGAFFCGSAALLRRRAVDEVGGISGETITEDAETALDIHALGWESRYLDHAMIAGLQPETFASFIQQRGRWATGMIQMLILKNPIFRSGLSIKQRLCYINSMSFWLFPLLRMVFLISPLFYMFFGLEIFVVSSPEVLVYILPYLLMGFLVQSALFSRVRWPQISEVYEIAQTPYLLRAIFDTVLRPRAASFKVTAKDEELNQAFLSPIVLPLLTLTMLILAGLVAGTFRWFAFPGDRTVVLLVGAWNLYNFLLVTFALRSVFENPRRLIRPRTAVNVAATLGPADGDYKSRHLAATIISATAKTMQLRIEPDTHSSDGGGALNDLDNGATLVVTPIVPKAPTLERPIGVTVTSVRSNVDGVAISAEIDADDMIRASEFVAFSVYGDSSRWEYFRKTHSRSRGLVSGLIFVVGKSVASVPQSLLGFLREPARRKQRLQFDTRMPATTYATPQQSDPRQRLNTENTVKDGEEKYLEVEG